MDPKKAQALRDWPDATSLEDVVSMRAYANYIREYIPDFAALDRYLRPYLKKGAKLSDFAADPKALEAYSGMRQACAEDAELMTFDDRAAAKGIAGGRPLELYIDASDYAWYLTLAQRPAKGAAPRTGVVDNKSLSSTKPSCSACERELYMGFETGSLQWSRG